MPNLRNRSFTPAAELAISSVLRRIHRHPTQVRRAAPRALVPSQTRRTGRTMVDSVRVRLTLWYTAVLALVLVILSLITYFIFWRSAVQRTDVNLAELSDAFLVTLRAELEDQDGPNPLKAAAQVAITEHNFRDDIYVIADDEGKVVT